MTKSEVWKLKVGTRVSDVFGLTVRIGTVVKREVYDDTCGFIIAQDRKTKKIVEKNIYTGRKQICVTVKFDDGYVRYYDTSNDNFRFKNFKVIN